MAKDRSSGSPGAWLMVVAERGAIDALRHERMRARKHGEIARTADEAIPLLLTSFNSQAGSG